MRNLASPCGVVLLLCTLGCESVDLGSPPKGTFVASTYEGTAPLSVTFVVEVAEDTEYTINRYEWDYDGDDKADQTTKTGQFQATVTHIYQEIGEYSPDVRVIFNEADAWMRPILNDRMSQTIVVK